ncbi:MAG: metalloregulator ArsR/SmtB family transcription factor [Chloroflexota bacterium]
MMTDAHTDKIRLYEIFAEFGKALASASRLELLDLLSQAPRTVEELAEAAHLSLANASQHLQRLKSAGLVTAVREGVFIRYRLAGPAVVQLWLALRAVGEQHKYELEPALNAYRPQRHDFPTIPLVELLERLESHEVTLIDVRPGEEYAAGHLPGAISIPLSELQQRLEELPPGRLVVAYCRGPYCVYADQALALLAARGWQGARLEEGVNEWQQAGYSLEG